MARKRLVSEAALNALVDVLNSLPGQLDNGGKLFATGSPLVDVELETDYDWALYNAAYRLSGGKV
jgi:hypothetical protein